MIDDFRRFFQRDLDHTFNCVYVIQSLPARQLQTGTSLFDTVIAPEAQRLSFHSCFWDVGDRAAFLEALRLIERETRENGLAPLLQVDAHGNEHGLEFADESTLDWAEIIPLLRSINIASRFNLFLLLATCFGFHLEQAIRPTEAAPVWGFIGPSSKVKAGVIEERFQSFYQTLFRTLNAPMAMEALNQAFLGTPWTFGFRSASNLFRMACASYLRLGATPDVLDRRALDLTAALLPAYPQHTLDSLRAIVRQRLGNHEHLLTVFAERYFMYDQFPENRNRFPFRYADYEGV